MKGGLKFFVCIFFILILSLSFISAGFFSDIWSRISGRAVEDCTDSDGGLAYAINGTACGTNGCLTDNCTNSTNLKESICVYSGEAMYLKHACSDGEICKDGACILACVPQTCSDLGYECGSWDDGCGGTLSCESCSDGYNCESGVCVVQPVGCVDYYLDSDGDGYGSSETQCLISLVSGYSTQSGDCDDTNVNINPDEIEVCDDGLDNNCDDNVDEGCVVSGGEDEEGIPGEVPGEEVEECIPEIEICDDEIDNDCDSLIDMEDDDCLLCEGVDDDCYNVETGECDDCTLLDSVDFNCNTIRTKLKARNFVCGEDGCEKKVLRSVIEECEFGCSEDEAGAHCMTEEESKETSLLLEILLDIFVANEDPAETSGVLGITSTSNCTPSDEICDGIDNDCDEEIDENSLVFTSSSIPSENYFIVYYNDEIQGESFYNVRAVNFVSDNVTNTVDIEKYESGGWWRAMKTGAVEGDEITIDSVTISVDKIGEDFIIVTPVSTNTYLKKADGTYLGCGELPVCIPKTCEEDYPLICADAFDGCGNIIDCSGCPEGYECVNRRCEEIIPEIPEEEIDYDEDRVICTGRDEACYKDPDTRQCVSCFDELDTKDIICGTNRIWGKPPVCRGGCVNTVGRKVIEDCPYGCSNEGGIIRCRTRAEKQQAESAGSCRSDGTLCLRDSVCCSGDCRRLRCRS